MVARLKARFGERAAEIVGLAQARFEEIGEDYSRNRRVPYQAVSMGEVTMA